MPGKQLLMRQFLVNKNTDNANKESKDSKHIEGKHFKRQFHITDENKKPLNVSLGSEIKIGTYAAKGLAQQNEGKNTNKTVTVTGEESCLRENGEIVNKSESNPDEVNEESIPKRKQQDESLQIKSVSEYKEKNEAEKKHENEPVKVIDARITKQADAKKVESESENEEAIKGAAVIAGESESLSEYEKQRLLNIRRNEEFLRSIGLSSSSACGSAKKYKTKANNKKRSQKRPRPLYTNDEARPQEIRRRSRRLVGQPLLIAQDNSNSEVIDSRNGVKNCSKLENIVPTYVDSSLQEILNKSFTFESVSISDGFDSLYDPDMKKAYSLNFHASKSLLLAGGHGGRIAIYNIDSTNGSGDTDPLLMSFKACRGWISNVQFLSGRDDSKHTYFLSASNDGKLILWDANKETEESGAAYQVCVEDDVHIGGIFSMHEISGTIATASKDSSVSLSTVTPDGSIQVMTRYEDLHDGVVKSVSLREDCDGKIFCSAGNDGVIRITDTRLVNKPGNTNNPLEIENMHDGYYINSVKWQPRLANEYKLMSTSFGKNIVINDMRNPTVPLLVLDKHHPTSCTKVKSIYHPTFYDGGKYIVTTGEQSTCLTTYEAGSGEVVCRKDIGIRCNSIAVHDMLSMHPILAASHGTNTELMKLIDC